MTGMPKSDLFKIERSFIGFFFFCIALHYSALKNNRMWKNNFCNCLLTAKKEQS